MTETNTSVEQNPMSQMVTPWTPDIAVQVATQMLYGIDRANDQQLWARETPSDRPIFAQDENRVYVPNKQNGVDIFDRRTGEKRSEKYLVGIRTIDELLQDNGLLFVASRDDVSAYDTSDFSKRWGKKLPVFRLAKSGELLYVSLEDYKGLAALQARSGEINWISDEQVRYVTADNTGVYGNQFELIKKLDKDGTKVWDSRVARSPVHVMAAHKDRLYIGEINGEFSALDTHTGRLIWKASELGKFPWQIEETAQGLEITVTEPYYARESRVIRLNPETGKQL